MNHCFQSLTGSFFPSRSPFPVCSFFLSFFSSPLVFLHSLLFSSLSFLLLVLSSLCQALSCISKDKNGQREGVVFMMVSIFHDVVLRVVTQPILSPGEPGFAVHRFKYALFFLFFPQYIGRLLFKVCVCVHACVHGRHMADKPHVHACSSRYTHRLTFSNSMIQLFVMDPRHSTEDSAFR